MHPHWKSCFPSKYSIENNLVTKFHEALTINVASKVLTRKNAPPPGVHVFIVTIPIFELIQDIIGTNLLTKFHKDQTINVAYTIAIEGKMHLGSHVFQPISIIFELVQDIIGMNFLTMLHEDPTISVASRPFIAILGKMPHPLGSHVFQANITIFKLIQDIIETNLLTKFHKDWTMRPLETIYNHIRKNAPPPGGHFHEHLTINVASRVLTIKMPHLINAMLNLLTKFHEDRTMNVASRVLTRFNYYSHKRINAPSHKWQPCFSSKRTHFLIQDIIDTNLPTKFHEDLTINAASSVNNANVDAVQRTTDKRRSQKLTMSTLCSEDSALD
ncbi:hypothetical protein DPMN_160892 [Dreissena polymorpha]|uniref:Uncharacterized protein n=1 Tax=Dreissena polymorpha TaxID=45954 RepID=A0A9D4EMF2_DREPO|nr:hypothetical protein DPMN_160892 [Dreissena polymorpha]